MSSERSKGRHKEIRINPRSGDDKSINSKNNVMIGPSISDAIQKPRARRRPKRKKKKQFDEVSTETWPVLRWKGKKWSELSSGGLSAMIITPPQTGRVASEADAG